VDDHDSLINGSGRRGVRASVSADFKNRETVDRRSEESARVGTGCAASFQDALFSHEAGQSGPLWWQQRASRTFEHLPV